MRIYFERSGGIAGIKLRTTIDTSALAASQGKQIATLLKACSFFDLPDSLRSSRPGADRFCFTIKVEDQAQCKELMVDEAAVSPALRPLIDCLLNAAKQGRREKGEGESGKR